MQILFRVECVDEVALQALLSCHPSGSAWEMQAGDRCKDWRMVHGLFDVEREEDRKSKILEAENKELRARIEALEKKGSSGCNEGTPASSLELGLLRVRGVQRVAFEYGQGNAEMPGRQ